MGINPEDHTHTRLHPNVCTSDVIGFGKLKNTYIFKGQAGEPCSQPSRPGRGPGAAQPPQLSKGRGKATRTPSLLTASRPPPPPLACCPGARAARSARAHSSRCRPRAAPLLMPLAAAASRRARPSLAPPPRRRPRARAPPLAPLTAGRTHAPTPRCACALLLSPRCGWVGFTLPLRPSPVSRAAGHPPTRAPPVARLDDRQKCLMGTGGGPQVS